MSPDTFVGRKDVAKQLESVLKGESRRGSLTVQSIEGPGGIGKTKLFDHVLDSTDLHDRQYLCIRIDGNTGNVVSLQQALVRMYSNASAKPLGRRMPGYYFGHTTRVIKAMDEVQAKALAEFAKQFPDSPVERTALSGLLNLAYSAGKRLNEIMPFTRRYLNVHKLEHWVGEAVTKLKALQSKTPRFYEKLGFGSTALHNSVKENACIPLSREFVADLTAILSPVITWKEWLLRLTHGKLKGINRLLLIIDDYEKLQPIVGEFLVSHFLPNLQKAEFPSVVLILGRDKLEATGQVWNASLASALLPPIDLKPLSKPELQELVAAFGIEDPEEHERAWRDTEGYPFCVHLWSQEMKENGRTAVWLQSFYDRTTRWMSELEQEWLRLALFLDNVNVPSMESMLAEPGTADEAFKWFKREGSIRDPAAKTFRVREYLRSRLIEYERLCNPKNCEELEQRARPLNARNAA